MLKGKPFSLQLTQVRESPVLTLARSGEEGGGRGERGRGGTAGKRRRGKERGGGMVVGGRERGTEKEGRRRKGGGELILLQKVPGLVESLAPWGQRREKERKKKKGTLLCGDMRSHHSQ